MRFGIAALLCYGVLAGTAPGIEKAASPAPQPVAETETEGLCITVDAVSLRAGEPVPLHWAITPDGITCASITLSLIFPDGTMYYYTQSKGFRKLDELSKTAKIVDDFPFSLALSGTLAIPTEKDWPAGTYQFAAFVTHDGTIDEIDYSNSFELQAE
jgi:hypothetical protein